MVNQETIESSLEGARRKRFNITFVIKPSQAAQNRRKSQGKKPYPASMRTYWTVKDIAQESDVKSALEEISSENLGGWKKAKNKLSDDRDVAEGKGWNEKRNILEVELTDIDDVKDFAKNEAAEEILKKNKDYLDKTKGYRTTNKSLDEEVTWYDDEGRKITDNIMSDRVERTIEGVGTRVIDKQAANRGRNEIMADDAEDIIDEPTERLKEEMPSKVRSFLETYE